MRRKIVIHLPRLLLMVCAGLLVLQAPARAGTLNQPERQESSDVFQRAFPGLAPPDLDAGAWGVDRLHQQFGGWPDLLETGGLAPVGEKTITLENFTLVPGQGEAVAFAPARGEKRPLHTPLSYIGTDWDRVFIPPDSSLLMVQVRVEPESPAGCADFRSYRFAAEAAGFPAAQAWYFIQNDRMGGFPPADTNCLSSGWLYFLLPVLDPAPGSIWVTVTSLTPAAGQPVFAVWQLGP